jgi:hypothetical protein
MQRFCGAIDTLQSHGSATVTHTAERCADHHHGSVRINPNGCRWISAQQLRQRAPQQLFGTVVVMDGRRREDIRAGHVAVRARLISKGNLTDTCRYRGHLLQHIRWTNTAAIRAQ